MTILRHITCIFAILCWPFNPCLAEKLELRPSIDETLSSPMEAGELMVEHLDPMQIAAIA